MERNYIEEKVFEKTDFSAAPLIKGEYELCEFINCNFSNSDLSDISFSECEFKNCNFAITKLIKTAFRDIRFKDCKLSGLHFENCDQFLFTVDFENCILDMSSFYQVKLKKTIFKNCSVREADFSGADLNNALFDNCDLQGTVFDNTILEKTDFRSAYNYSIDPAVNKVKKAKFSRAGILGLLYKYDIDVE